MRILLVEDENSVADRIKRLTQQVAGVSFELMAHRSTLRSGLDYLQQHPIDLLMLDLNLNGKDGLIFLRNYHHIVFKLWWYRPIPIEP